MSKLEQILASSLKNERAMWEREREWEGPLFIFGKAKLPLLDELQVLHIQEK
jgi:hypothetical protein